MPTHEPHQADPRDVPAFRQSWLPIAERVSDLLARLSTGEKIAMVHQHSPGVPRLGIMPFHTGNEALHGVAWLGEATVFPQAVGLGATWHPELVKAVGEVTGVEARALHARDPLVSLNVWAPVVNLLRDPRWGRNEEGYSEDVLLTTSLAIAYCRGLRGDHPVYARTAPTLKHFLAYNNETDRAETSSTLRPRVLHEYDLPAFREPIAAGVVDGVMPSYNLVNGRPNHVSPYINGLLRQWTSEELLVVSDAQAPSNLVDCEHYFDDHITSHAAALRAGVDSFTDNSADSSHTIARITEALERGLITIEDIDRAVGRTFTIRFRTGEFDPELDPYASIGVDALDRPEHRALARQVAREQIVLLKNQGELLPLTPRAGMRLAVVGPFADSLRTDWYSGTMPYRVTIAAGLRAVLEPLGGVVTSAEAVDRITLLATGAGRRVRVLTDGDAPVLALGERDPGVGDESELFDVFDWGDDVITLRSVASGRFVTAKPREEGGRRAGEQLIADQEQPNGWDVYETFHLVEHEGGALLRNAHTGRYVTVDPGSGELRASTDDIARAERFVSRLIHTGAEQAYRAMAKADAVVVVVGNDTHINGRETQDRTTLALPPAQERLVRAVATTGKPTVLTVMSSYPYAISWAERHVPAIVWTSHAGQETGNALADVLFGAHAPSGRLPQTWYREDADLPDLLEYDIIKLRRTYQYFAGDPLFVFGHGLSYTTFAYGEPRALRRGDDIVVSVDVTNTGDRAGVEVVQVYGGQVDPPADRPRRRLLAYARVELGPGETRAVTVEFQVSALAFWDVADHDYRVDPGVYEFFVGGSSAATAVTRLEVAGEPARPRRVVGVDVRAADFDDYEDVTLVDVTREMGDAVAPLGDRPGWIVVRAADLDSGVNRFSARVSRTSPGVARLTLRRDDPVDGAILADVAVPSTGARYTWTTIETDATAEPGVYDLYLVFSGEQRVETFRLDA